MKVQDSSRILLLKVRTSSIEKVVPNLGPLVLVEIPISRYTQNKISSRSHIFSSSFCRSPPPSGIHPPFFCRLRFTTGFYFVKLSTFSFSAYYSSSHLVLLCISEIYCNFLLFFCYNSYIYSSFPQDPRRYAIKLLGWLDLWTSDRLEFKLSGSWQSD